VSASAETAYLFRHALLRDAAYQLQLPGDRARLHGLAFALIEDLFGGRPPELRLLAAGEEAPFAPHATDAFGRELAAHARLSQSGEAGREAARLYLLRAALAGERDFQPDTASAAWEELSALVPGAEPGDFLRRAGANVFEAGRIGRAEALLERALAIQRKSGNARGEAWVMGNLAAVHAGSGRLGPAEAEYERAIRMHRAAGNSRVAGVTLGNLGELLRQAGRTQEAELRCREALEIHRREGRDKSLGMALGNLGIVCMQTGRVEEAERCYEEALALLRRAGERRMEGVVLGNRAMLLAQRGRADESRLQQEQALALHRETGNRRFEGIALGTIARNLRSQGAFDEAEPMFRRAIEVLRDVGDVRSEGIITSNFGILWQKKERWDEAERCLQRALALSRQAGDRGSECDILGLIAGLLLDSGFPEKAARQYEEVLPIVRRSAEVHSLASHLCNYALVLVSLRRTAEAVPVWEEGIGLLGKLGDQRILAEAHAAMREANHRAGVQSPEGGGA